MSDESMRKMLGQTRWQWYTFWYFNLPVRLILLSVWLPFECLHWIVKPGKGSWVLNKLFPDVPKSRMRSQSAGVLSAASHSWHTHFYVFRKKKSRTDYLPAALT